MREENVRDVFRHIRMFELKITQAEQARRLTEVTGKKWDDPMVSRLEGGDRKITLELLEQMADAQGVDDLVIYFRPLPKLTGTGDDPSEAKGV